MRWLLETYPDLIKPTLSKCCAAGLSWCLAACFEENDAEMLQILIDAGADPNIDDGSWMPKPVRDKPLMRYVILPRVLALLHRTIKRPSNLIEVFSNCLGATPLHVVATHGNLRSLEVLLKAGAKLEGAYTSAISTERRPCTARPRAATRPSQSGYLKSARRISSRTGR